MKLARAWHLFITGNGERATTGGRPLTVGIDRHGRVWLTGEAIWPDGTQLSDGAAAWLSAALAGAIRPASETDRANPPTPAAEPAPDTYQSARDRFDHAHANYRRARAEADRILSEADDECEAARADLARRDPEPAAPFTTVPRLRRLGDNDGDDDPAGRFP